MPSFRCADIGMNCAFEVKNGTTKDEVVQIASVHAKIAHGMTSMAPDVAAKVAAAIH